MKNQISLVREKNMCFVLIDKKWNLTKYRIEFVNTGPPGKTCLTRKTGTSVSSNRPNPVVFQIPINLCSYQQIQATYNELNPGLIEDNGWSQLKPYRQKHFVRKYSDTIIQTLEIKRTRLEMGGGGNCCLFLFAELTDL